MAEGPVVLVVDDVRDVRTLVCRLLESRGYGTLAAQDGREALEVLEAKSAGIDLLLTDVVMPRMDGIALCQAVSERWPHLPLLVMSGECAPSSLPRSARFLAKPFTPDRLFVKVEQSLGERAQAAGQAAAG